MTLRTFPNCKTPALRFQFGVIETRPERKPIYDGRQQVIGYETEGNKIATVFRLLGWGSTEELARHRVETMKGKR